MIKVRENRTRLSCLLVILAMGWQSQQVVAQATQVSREDWLASMQQILPAYFCESAQYFRQCFSVDATQCAEVISNKTSECLSQNETNIPAVLNQPQDGTHWGTIVGRCVGTLYELELREAKISNTQCNNPNHWR